MNAGQCPSRIVSLLPGATEIVCALGLRDALVGRSHECDYPPGIEALPICSRPRLDPSANGRTIDASVRSLVSQGLSVFEVDAAQLQALAPEAIVTQIQCEVCAVSEGEVRAAVANWLGEPPVLASTSASSLAGLWDDMRRVGDALGVSHRAEALVADCQRRLEALTARTGSIAARPTVACIEWVEPLMSSGNWMPTLIDTAGGRSVLASEDTHSPWIQWSDVRDADPDVLVISPCGFDLERAVASADLLRGLPGWNDLGAVQAGNVWAVDGHQYFHRPGPRLVESAAILAWILHGVDPAPLDPEHAARRLPWGSLIP